MKVVCMYHRADLDGKCSAAIVLGEHPNVVLVPCDYGDPEPEMPEPGTKVFVVDFSWPMPVMERLAENGPLMWIDHHVSAIKEASARGFNPPGIRRVGTAGCELTWEWFDECGVDAIPKAVRLLGRYDVYDEKRPDWYTDVLPFQYGMRLSHWFPEDRAWLALFGSHASDYVVELTQQGRAILAYQGQQDAVTMQRAFEADLDGYHVIACNCDEFGSRSFATVYDSTKHAAMLAFHWRPGVGWKCSLYTTRDDVDCAAIAQVYGGGGHRKAAGFQRAVLPFKLEVR